MLTRRGRRAQRLAATTTSVMCALLLYGMIVGAFAATFLAWRP